VKVKGGTLKDVEGIEGRERRNKRTIEEVNMIKIHYMHE
jgi:hypothetical protein